MTEKREASAARGQVRVTSRQVQAARIAIKADTKLGRTPSPALRKIAEAKRVR